MSDEAKQVELKVLHADKLPNCSRCRDNFYNASQSGCWSLPSAKMVWRWRINMQTPMAERSAFTRVRVLNCFHGEGPHRDIFMKRLPEHLGGDWADERDRLADELTKVETLDARGVI